MNTVQNTIYQAILDEFITGKLKKGDLAAMTAFGGGLSSGGCIIRW